MSEEPTGTKLAIIEAAGELFAESGIDAVGIRSIAEKAGVNIAAVNYHFGSKENLSVAIFRHIVSHSSKGLIPGIVDSLGRNPSPAELAETVRSVVRLLFGPFLRQEKPQWHDRYSLRVMLRPSEAFQPVMRGFFLPEHQALMRLARLCRPELNDEQAMAIALSLNAHCAFYFLAREPLELMLSDRFDRGYFETVVEEITRLYLAAFGLDDSAG